LLAFITVTSLLWQPGQAALVVAAIGMVGGLIMASTVAATSGWALVRLLGSVWSQGRTSAGA
jgi:DMSO/TMAO reductase YedYZ heme-binding membrane subunit